MFDKLAQVGVKVGMHLIKHSHTYLTVAGAAGSIGTVVLTVKATHKMDDLNAKYKETTELIETNAAGFDEETVKQDLASAHVDYMVQSTKIIAPVALLGVASLACFGLAWGISSNRIKALAGAYSVLKLEYDKYREATREEVGEEKEQEIYLEAKERTRQVLEQASKVDKFGLHGRWFDESAEFVKDDLAYDRTYIEKARKKMEDLLGRRGYILLNDLFDALAMDRTKDGMWLGWKIGDGFDLFEKLVVTTEDNDEQYTSIYLSWPAPVPVYDDVELEGRYAVIN